MSFNTKSNLWPDQKEHWFGDRTITPQRQEGPACLRTSLAMLAGKSPADFSAVNTQDPISWSDSLKPYAMKLAYCPFDVRKLRFYMDELIALDDLFLLCYYTGGPTDMLRDPREDGWVCGSHVVILHRASIIDPMYASTTPAKEHSCNGKHTKRIFRVVPADCPRGL